MGSPRDYLSLIRFSHTAFALPFALITLLLATDGRPGPRLLVLVVLAVVLARAAALAYNAWADRALDARNPRTRNREIPRGAIRAPHALAFTAACAVGFLVVCALLGPLCLLLGLPVLAVLLGYSHAKHFTSLAHLWLGLALGLAPVASWVAARGAVDGSIGAALLLGVGVMLWVAGFDILYACQDEAFDRGLGLHSIPVRLGRRVAFRLSALLHLGAGTLLLVFGWLAGLAAGYFAGAAITGGLLLWEHRLLAPGDLARIDLAFFTANGLVSLTMLAGTCVDLYVTA